MKNGIIKVECFADYRRFDETIDVRTPAEFAEDHIPGSINCPVLDNEQRIEVGTLYKQASPFAAKKIGAAYVAENIACHIRESFHDRPQDWKPLVVCWRGGQRSGAMTLILRRIGWDAQQLQGGYKDYRRLVVAGLAELPRRFRFKVICGATGSGKSRVLQSLSRLGRQVLNLEAMASHKGSILGVLPNEPQPAQKMFETRLMTALAGMSPKEPVYVEAESRKIGLLHVPDALLESLRAGDCISIDADFEARVDFLLRDYDYFLNDPYWLDSRLDVLGKLHSRETIRRWKDYVASERWRELVAELLEQHYDPHYARSQRQNFSRFAQPVNFPTNSLSDNAIDAIAQRIAAAW